MSRMFDTTFSYRGAEYTATVTISKAEEENTICVEVPDRSLHEVLPGGKITFEGDTVKQDDQEPNADPRLIESLRKAIQSHEEDMPETSLWS